MTDSELIDLFFRRNERVIDEVRLKYSTYCITIAKSILRSDEDAEECLNDMLLAAWNSIPPAKPENMQTFLGKLMRNAAIGYWRKSHADKRGSGHIELLLEELSDAAASDNAFEHLDDSMSLRETFNSFLGSLSKEQRVIFLKRYWYMHTVSEIADELHTSESKVKVTLCRTRKKLKKLLEREGSL